jgi:type III secretion protein C
LQWFGKGQLKNQLGFGTGNFGSGNPLTSTTNVPNFSGVGSGISLTQFPNGQSIPFFGNQSGGGNAPSGAGFDLGVIGDVLFHKGQSFLSLGSLVNAIQADADATIVMNPKILTQDSHNSTIFIGQNIPFIGSNVTNSAANTTQSANIEYRDVGTNLSITPKLGDDNVVTLEITYNMSAQVPNTNGGQGGFNGIQTSQTNMTTRVHVPDQHFVVLSGMLQDTRQHYKTGLPCLGGLPIIGLAFSDNERFNNKNNILIFIRPCIINHLEDLKELTEKQENKYRDMFEKQIDREDFDAAINLVKDPADE